MDLQYDLLYLATYVSQANSLLASAVGSTSARTSRGHGLRVRYPDTKSRVFSPSESDEKSSITHRFVKVIKSGHV